MTEPTDAVVIPFSRDRRRSGNGKPQRAVSPPSSPSATDEPGALFEAPTAVPQRLRAAKPAPATKPKRPREPKRAPPPPSRPALRAAGPDHELCEGMKRTRRVRVTFEADVHEAHFGLEGRLILTLVFADGQREVFAIADRNALVEVIERAEGETA
jgi:hypothetical protein